MSVHASHIFTHDVHRTKTPTKLKIGRSTEFADAGSVGPSPWRRMTMTPRRPHRRQRHQNRRWLHLHPPCRAPALPPPTRRQWSPAAPGAWACARNHLRACLGNGGIKWMEEDWRGFWEILTYNGNSSTPVPFIPIHSTNSQTSPDGTPPWARCIVFLHWDED
jgi:hypothetical protein